MELERRTMQKFAEAFYKSRDWRNTRELYMQRAGGLCERCLAAGMYKPAEIVHHKIHLTKDNINNPKVALAFDNLEALCRDCHAEAHGEGVKRYKLDELGRVIIK